MALAKPTSELVSFANGDDNCKHADDPDEPARCYLRACPFLFGHVYEAETPVPVPGLGAVIGGMRV